MMMMCARAFPRDKHLPHYRLYDRTTTTMMDYDVVDT